MYTRIKDGKVGEVIEGEDCALVCVDLFRWLRAPALTALLTNKDPQHLLEGG